MNHYEDCSEVERTVLKTTTYFEELVESINKYKENSGSAASQYGLESAANVQERKRVDTMLETLTRRVERAEDENNHLREAVNGNFKNCKRVEEKVNTERATINNLLEKMTNMERKSEERIEEMMRDHKADLKRARVNDSGGSSGGGYRGNKGSDGGYQGDSGYSGDGEREYKNPKLDWVEEKRARNRVKCEKRVKDKLDKPGNGWANKRDRHDPDMINWGAYRSRDLICRTVPGGGVTRSAAVNSIFTTQVTFFQPLY